MRLRGGRTMMRMGARALAADKLLRGRETDLPERGNSR